MATEIEKIHNKRLEDVVSGDRFIINENNKGGLYWIDGNLNELLPRGIHITDTGTSTEVLVKNGVIRSEKIKIEIYKGNFYEGSYNGAFRAFLGNGEGLLIEKILESDMSSRVGSVQEIRVKRL